MWYTYSEAYKPDGSWDEANSQTNLEEFFEYIDGAREELREMHLADGLPLVVAGSSLGGPVAVQVAAELGASLLFLKKTAPCLDAFCRVRFLYHSKDF
jgi:predicted alpha/beta-hydrolase family hydrolase